MRSAWGGDNAAAVESGAGGGEGLKAVGSEGEWGISWESKLRRV